MPTAPRFQPSGVSVGGMPTPQVRPQTGMAEGVAAAGETIASLGKSYQFAKDVQERRAKIEEASNETAGELAFQKWNQAQKARYDKFQTDAQGEKIGKVRDEFVSGLAGDTSAYTKDLSPQAIAAFEKRRSLQSQTYSDSAGNIAHDRSGRFIVGVKQAEYKESAERAAAAAAGNDMVGFITNVDRGWAAKQETAKITGEKVDDAGRSAYRAAALVGALELVKRQGSDVATVDFYERYKTAFGADAAAAKLLAQDSQDNLTSADVAILAAGLAKQDSGLVDWAAARRYALTDSEHSPSVQAKIQKSISGMAKAEEEMRASVGEAAMAKLRIAHTMPIVKSDTDALTNPAQLYFDSPEAKKAMEIMLPKDRAAFEDAATYGGKTRPDDMFRTMGLYYSDRDAFMKVRLEEGVYSTADALKIRELQNQPIPDADEAASKACMDIFTAHGVGKRPDQNNPKEMAAFATWASAVAETIKSQPQDKTVTLEQRARQAAISLREQVRRSAPGGIFTPNEEMVRLSELVRKQLPPEADDPAVRARLGFPKTGALTPDQKLQFWADQTESLKSKTAKDMVAPDSEPSFWDSLTKPFDVDKVWQDYRNSPAFPLD